MPAPRPQAGSAGPPAGGPAGRGGQRAADPDHAAAACRPGGAVMNHEAERRVTSFLGLCLRAGRLVTGQEACVELIRRGGAALALVDEGASANTLKRLADAMSESRYAAVRAFAGRAGAQHRKAFPHDRGHRPGRHGGQAAGNAQGPTPPVRRTRSRGHPFGCRSNTLQDYAGVQAVQ